MTYPCHTVAVLGFSDFERKTLASFFRLAQTRTPCYVLVTDIAEAAFVVADADHEPSVQLVFATDRLSETVFIGSHQPPGSLAWRARPIDPLHVVRELDSMIAMRSPGAAPEVSVAPSPAIVPAPEPGPGPEQDAAMPAPLPAPIVPPPVAPPEAPAVATIAPPPAEPAAESQASTSSLPSVVPALPAAEMPMSPARAVPRSALIVDDSAIATRFLETRLARWGMVVTKADRSQAALALLAQQEFEFVFLDVELGEDSELDGLGICQQIKRRTVPKPRSVVVMVSAHHGELDLARGALAGCDAYLGKPLVQAELERVMQRVGAAAA